MFNSLVIIEQFVTNFYNLDNCVNLYFIRKFFYLYLYKIFVNKITKSHVLV